jgi:hypothetical protein
MCVSCSCYALLQCVFQSDVVVARYRLFNAFWPPLEASVGAFDRVHVGAAIAPGRVPQLLRLLRVGGLLVAPVRDGLFQIRKLDEAGGREE